MLGPRPGTLQVAVVSSPVLLTGIHSTVTLREAASESGAPDFLLSVSHAGQGPQALWFVDTPSPGSPQVQLHDRCMSAPSGRPASPRKPTTYTEPSTLSSSSWEQVLAHGKHPEAGRASSCPPWAGPGLSLWKFMASFLRGQSSLLVPCLTVSHVCAQPEANLAEDRSSQRKGNGFLTEAGKPQRKAEVLLGRGAQALGLAVSAHKPVRLEGPALHTWSLLKSTALPRESDKALLCPGCTGQGCCPCPSSRADAAAPGLGWSLCSSAEALAREKLHIVKASVASHVHRQQGAGKRCLGKLLPIKHQAPGWCSHRCPVPGLEGAGPLTFEPWTVGSATSLGVLRNPEEDRPSSGSASASGSPSDPGFMSLDEYGSSPGDLRAFCSSHRSNTPESIAETPPARDGAVGELYGYMSMDRPSGPLGRPYRRVSGDAAQDLDRGLRKRTYSLTTPARQRPVPQPSSASLDEYTLMRATFSGSSGRLCPPFPASSPKVAYHPYPEDYGDIEIGSHRSSSSNLGADDGYMPMTPGAALLGSASDDYMPMSPTSVSAPKQILHPRAAPAAALPPSAPPVPAAPSPAGKTFPGPVGGYKAGSPAESSPEDSGYMRMWCGSKLSVESADPKLLASGDYLNMSPSEAGPAGTPPDFFSAALQGAGEGLRSVPGCCYSSLPRSYKGPYLCGGADSDQYVLMSSPVGRILEEEGLESPATPGAPPWTGRDSHIQPHHLAAAVPAPMRPGSNAGGRPEGFFGQRCRAVRPTRLSLEGLQTLPSMHEYPLPPEPRSPGEYINIDFGEAGPRLSPLAPSLLASAASPSPLLSASSPASSLSLGSGTPGTSSDSRQRSPLSDYMNLGFSSPKSPKPGGPSAGASVSSQTADSSDYAEMAFGLAAPPKPEGARVSSPAAGLKRLSLRGQGSGLEAFLQAGQPPDPHRGAKVIRADPQGGRRRHSSETFSSTATVTPVSPSFAHNPKRHSSASVENVSLRKSSESGRGPGPPLSRTRKQRVLKGDRWFRLLSTPGVRSQEGLGRSLESGGHSRLGLECRGQRERESPFLVGDPGKAAQRQELRPLARAPQPPPCQLEDPTLGSHPEEPSSSGTLTGRFLSRQGAECRSCVCTAYEVQMPRL
ncbi:Insulin receptor substrate 2 [Heterocephalus glaber]|uniref:Insulin receptor substrate 2 n=1 Tax=Heterocephalus glaber TaxID=10181 RepID=G5AZ49_HETGA|nr:Insulin receptor substrate 2 [Heterocephalus glaber]